MELLLRLPPAGDPLVTTPSLLFLAVHEGTLVHAVSVLSQWTGRLTIQVPAALLDWLKKAFSLKTSTSLVRHAYLQAMLGAFRGGLVGRTTCWFCSCSRAWTQLLFFLLLWLQVTLCPKRWTLSRCSSRRSRRPPLRTPSMLCSQRAWRRPFC